MKKVLIISYYSSPEQTIAGVRIKGLAKYLPEYSWEPTILTPSLEDTLEADKGYRVVETSYPGAITGMLKEKLGYKPKQGLQQQIGFSPDKKKGETPFSKLVRYFKSVFIFPDSYYLWEKPAISKASNLLEAEDFDAIVSSYMPATAHLIAKKLSQKYDIPWIADFRDLWSQRHSYKYGKIRKWFDKRLEITTIKNANALVTVSEPLADKLSKLHGKASYSVPNGFDPDNLSKTDNLTEKFTITYTGNIYSGKQDPALLFQGVNELIEGTKLNPEAMKIRFFGKKRLWLEKEANEFNLGDIVTQYGFVSREEAISKQKESQILLILNWDDPVERGIYTGKLFEYLAAKRPILSVGGPRENVVRELLDTTQAGVFANELETIKDALMRWWKEYIQSGKVSYHGIADEVSKYSHRHMARKYAEVLESVQ